MALLNRCCRNWKLLMVSISLGIINLGGLYIFSVNSPRHSEPCQVSIPATTEKPKLEESICAQYKNTIAIQEQLLEDFKSRNNKREKSWKQVDTPSFNSTLPIIYMITPTYQRWTQKADLTRLCYTLMHVPNLHWIVVEDAEQKSTMVTSLLSRQHSCKIQLSTHLNIRTPKPHRRRAKDPVWLKSRGVQQRNIALMWLREAAANNQLQQTGYDVIYFGDDDNVYDLRVFEEMRYTKKVSMWPVGLSGGMKFEGPICKKGKVVDWYAMWDRERYYMIDMAGFAINLQLLLSKPSASMDQEAKRGRLEDSILKHLVTQDDLEPKADNCSKVLVWHIRTEPAKMRQELALIKKGKPSDPRIEV